MGLGWSMTHDSTGMVFGAAAYLLYSLGSRRLLLGAHRRGMRHLRNREFEEAIREFERSFAFFTRHPWLDRYRSIAMMMASAMSYREMAMINIAFAYSQIGEGAKAKEYYHRVKEEFPHNGMADAAIKLIESIEQAGKA